jgi:hypothetical protein
MMAGAAAWVFELALRRVSCFAGTDTGAGARTVAEGLGRLAEGAVSSSALRFRIAMVFAAVVDFAGGAATFEAVASLAGFELRVLELAGFPDAFDLAVVPPLPAAADAVRLGAIAEREELSRKG